MSLANVQQQLGNRHNARSLAESDGVSSVETPRRNHNPSKHLSPKTESAESKSPSYACAPTRAREVERGKTDSSDSGDSAAAPRPMILLKHCRCIDCRNWIKAPYCECRYGIIRNGVKDTPDFPADAWHYCARYRGPQISRDVWVWPKVPPTAAQVGAGSNISAELHEPTASAQERDVRKARVNGSFVGI